MGELLNWTREPGVLRRPVLIVSLEGFVDAGAAASTAAMFLRHRWRSELFATFDRDTFLDFRARRPTVVVDSGEIRRIEWPTIELLSATTEGPHDALFLLGPEPDMRWEAFSAAVADLCEKFGVEAVVGLGAYPAAVPHTRPTRIVRAGNGVGGDIVPSALPVIGYTGPVGMGTVLHAVLGEHGIPAVGLWAEVPHYIAGTPHPGSALALVQLVTAALHAEVDTGELEAAARVHREQVDAAVAEHEDATEMIHTLEQYLEEDVSTEGLPTGEELAAEIERFLRHESD